MKEWILRKAMASDAETIEFLTREAFWDVYQPGCDEHYIVHCLREDPAVVEALNCVCECGGEIVGHILYTRAKVVDAHGVAHPVLAFGPISVRPDMQRIGVGSRLIRHTLQIAARMGFDGVVITGNPAYYHRFGFQPAADFGIIMHDGTSFPELMAMALRPGSLNGVSGRMYFSPKFFEVDPEKLAEYDAQFPAREKRFGMHDGGEGDR